VRNFINQSMRYIISILIILFVSCRSKDKNDEIESRESKQKTTSPTVIPSKLKLKAISHDLILNTNLFDSYQINKGDSVEMKTEILNTELFSDGKFCNYLKKSKIEEPETYGPNEMLKFDLSFECENCYDATLFRLELNSKEFLNDTSFIDFLNDPATTTAKIKREGSLFRIRKELSLKYDGLLGIYLALRNKANEVVVYEIAGIKSDASAPSFSQNEFCTFTGDTTYQGMVCLTTKEFQGNDYFGYSVPIKGHIYGDVKLLRINGRNFKPIQGEFYQRIPMMLKMGYNQIPVIIKDRFSNTTEAYIQVTLSRIKDSPDINIENNIDVEK
jgi:hypothetical protein